VGTNSEKLNQRPCKQEEEIRRKKEARFYWPSRLELDARDLAGGATPKEEQNEF